MSSPNQAASSGVSATQPAQASVTTQYSPPRSSGGMARWSVGGVFLEALANRDYERMATTLASGVRFRAMLPPGPMEWEGPDAVADAFSSWFGEAHDFELVDAAVGEVGGRLHLSWRL